MSPKGENLIYANFSAFENKDTILAKDAPADLNWWISRLWLIWINVHETIEQSKGKKSSLKKVKVAKNEKRVESTKQRP